MDKQVKFDYSSIHRKISILLIRMEGYKYMILYKIQLF